MNREIKFRGLRTDGKGWAIGDYNCFNNCHSIRFRDDVDPCEVRVNPETVGQFTGLTDKNGKEIFEGDIESTNGLCEWHAETASFVWHWHGTITVGMEGDEKQWCEITGNIHTP